MVDISHYKSVQERIGQDSSLAVAMSISGGGSRAANFGIGIMTGLEQLKPVSGTSNALSEVDYLSTVSGGGFAAGAYIGSLFDHHQLGHTVPFRLADYLTTPICNDLCYSYSGVLLRANFNPRLWFSLINDGDALEKAIDDYVLGYKRRKKVLDSRNRSILLADIFVPKDSGLPVRYPMHVANSSTLNTMAIFPFTPDVLERYGITGYTHRLRKVNKETLNPFLVPLAVGIKASGSFPVLISDSTLKSEFSEDRPYLHLIDGAMTDNTGYYTAVEILRQDDSPRKVLIVVDADATGNRFTFSKREHSVSSISVLARLPVSGLDARRSTITRDIQAICEAEDITPIFFGFSALIQDNEAPVPTVIDLKQQQERLIQALRDEAMLTAADRQVLYELLIQIDTKYTMLPEEQELLILAGEYLVQLQAGVIREAMGW